MSTLKSINVIHPSATVNNIVNDASGNVTVGNDLYVTTGNVGIGTASPDANLSVFGSTAVAADVGGEISIGGFYNGSSKTSYGSIAGVNQNGTGNTSGQLLFKTRTNFGSLTERMRIDSSGNVGIGATPYDDRLTISASTGSKFRLASSTSTSNAQQIFTPVYNATRSSDTDYGNGGTLFVGSADNGVSGTNANLWTSAGGYLGSSFIAFSGYTASSAYQGDMRFFTKSNGAVAERMRIDSSGNVGIGTASTGSTLHLYRNSTSQTSLNVEAGAAASYAPGIYLTDSRTASVKQFQLSVGGYANAFYIQDQTASAVRFLIDTSGNVGIGTTAPSALLHVSAAAAKIRIGADASSAYTDIYRDNATGYTIYNAAQAATFRGHIWQLGGTEAMRIDSSGNVGIGATANASAILDAQSTTKGVRFPNMTTTQKNAVSSPAAGLVVFDTTLAKLCVYSGTAWETVTSL